MPHAFQTMRRAKYLRTCEKIGYQALRTKKQANFE